MTLLKPLACLLALAALSHSAQAQQAPLKQDGLWAQSYLDREADPAIRFGRLDNGLRYAILRNDTPKGAVSMRMLIGSGSLKESDEERGLAHFLEHMAFRGSANVADGDVVHILERHGLRFGPDTNAMTSFDRTLYMFNFPDASDDSVDTGLMLFREIGERLTLDPKAIEAEKGVVLSEERLRDTPSLQATKAALGLLFQDTLVPQRLPIGSVETIQGATAERLRRYYRANYQPDNATIVVVGAIDPDAIEAKIKAGFADWQSDVAEDRFEPVAPGDTVRAAEFVADGAPDELSVNWVGPADERAETVAVDQERLRRLLAVTALNNRLGDAALKPGSPFAAARTSLSDSYVGVGSLVSIGIQADPDKWNEALQAVMTEQRMLLRDGLSDDELKRAVNAILAQAQAAADAASTRRDEALATALAQAAKDGSLFTSPAQDLALMRQTFAAETADSVSEAARTLFAGEKPLLFRSARAQPVTTPVLEQGLAAAMAKPLPAAEIRQAATWPYSSFGAPGAVTSRKDDPALGVTFVTFQNGTRLVAKQTDFEKDRISVSVGFGTGEAGLSPALAHANWAVGLFTSGGLGKFSVPQLRNYTQTQGKLGGVQSSISATRLWLSGGTRPADFEFQMDLLAAFATDPGFRPEMADQLRSVAPMLKTRIDTNAGQVFQRGVSDLIHGGDTRFSAVPSDADIDATSVEDLAVMMRPQLGTPADVAIVGDIPVDEAIRVTAATFGALPRSDRPAEPELRIDMAEAGPEPHVFLHGGRADQGYYGMVWQLPDFHSNPRLSRVADVTAALIQARLVDTVREKLGLTYSPSANAYASVDLAGLGYLMVSNETPPEKFEELRSAVLGVIASLATDPISDDELDRARKPLVETSEKAFETNGFWVQGLGMVLRDPTMHDQLVNEPEILASVTAQEVKSLLATYVQGKTPLTALARKR